MGGMTGVHTEPESDASIVARSHAEPEAFAAVFDRYAADVHRYAARRLGDEAADDVMAETFTTAFRLRDRFDPGRGDVRPWLFGIATHLVSRHRRAEARRFRALSRLPAPAETDEPLADRVAARATADGLRRELATALARLSPALRDVLLLVAWADLAYEEVAQALDVPVGTVRSRLHRARGRLRKELGAVAGGRDVPDAGGTDTDHAGTGRKERGRG
ncbi:sigma-70 family RNA polymerase sigma factor [Streptomyces sp. WMMC500]|uniref:RNA polymerase sigma factor n=1 Tax=Streptomyces sp. WMMC500 TaxID=3015154 RepID=UPI00248B2670|nr:sigma-70 family RNA polymerase sigma factor [Streptomyces sp. WMMC500]WBB59868.1 sigma-70 family RNA polymerase sigma factor [Streptomyces sp. WMMC500]